MSALTIGLSTCPNDTFLFHGLFSGQVDTRGLELAFELADVEELNRRLAAGRYDVAKGSFHAALLATDELCVLPVGAALGFGVGPLLLAASDASARAPEPRVLCPGAHTTATLLYHLFHAGRGRVEQVVFSEIMPALRAGRAELGVCIHEGRFTYAAQGLTLVEDLGERWERSTGAPLPLGGLLARKSLGAGTLRTLSAVLADSLAYGHAHRAETAATMARHAQELAEEVLFQHVDLYVNAWTAELGPAGRAALATLDARARAAGLLPRERAPLEVCGA